MYTRKTLLNWPMFVLGCLFLWPAVASATTPSSPFGQSNTFAFNTNRVGFGETAILHITSAPESGTIPMVTALGRATPNPFNPSIDILFNVGKKGNIDLNIYDLGGRLVRKLATQEFTPGRYSRTWDGRDNSGSLAPAGVYLVRLQGAAVIDTRKITLVK